MKSFLIKSCAHEFSISMEMFGRVSNMSQRSLDPHPRLFQSLPVWETTEFMILVNQVADN